MDTVNGALRAELLLARKRPGVWIIGSAWTAMAVCFGMVVPYIVYLAIKDQPKPSQNPQDLLEGLLPDRFLATAVGLYPMFGSALMLILGVVFAGGEYRWGTWGTLLVQRPGRGAAVLVKALAAAITVLLVSLAVIAVTAAASGIIAAATGKAAHWPSVGDWLGGIGAAWLAGLAAASLGMLLAVLLRATGAAIGVGLLWLLAVESLVNGLGGALPALSGVRRALLGPNVGSLATALDPTGEANSSIPGVVSVSGPLPATLVLAGYTALFLGLAVWLLRRRDIS
ncbi:ABC transporter permease subunit [Streptomyces palmae]|uniref:ABC transporter permease n=1 Tax=Streptomyces palmae TaxID=1701085 RepID=A0A4Z0HBN2_9ACTN|nr:ABC transporter permease subunit [Streptomyces palmae]TGB16625.1 hypothetical protein E4099_05025 [Streptomyces palmae]